MLPALMPRLLAALLAVAATQLALVGVADAADAPPAGSAIDQYVEVIPTGTGGLPSRPTSSAPSESPAVKLPPALQERLSGEVPEEADTLAKIATAPAAGAPPAGSLLSHSGARPGDPDEVTVQQIVSLDDARLLGLLVALPAITVAGIVAAWRDRKGRAGSLRTHPLS